jgi:hypothetical protein
LKTLRLELLAFRGPDKMWTMLRRPRDIRAGCRRRDA